MSEEPTQEEMEAWGAMVSRAMNDAWSELEASADLGMARVSGRKRIAKLEALIRKMAAWTTNSEIHKEIEDLGIRLDP